MLYAFNYLLECLEFSVANSLLDRSFKHAAVHLFIGYSPQVFNARLTLQRITYLCQTFSQPSEYFATQIKQPLSVIAREIAERGCHFRLIGFLLHLQPYFRTDFMKFSLVSF